MAIIKYRVSANVTRTDESEDRNTIASDWQYEDCKNPDKEGKILSREEAVRLIRERGYIMVHSNRYGAIYDSPNEPFLEEFGGHYERK